jgi:HK97 family phage prohead protease
MAVKRAQFPAEFKTLGDKGKVEAIVSVFGNVDRIGDRVMPGAFQKTIAAWKESGDPVPVILSHSWDDPWAHIGVVDDLEEVDKGLKATYTLDIDSNPVAAQVYRLMKRRSLKEHSFGYEIRDERIAKDGANELLDVDLIEIGPTLKGMNSDTELLGVKSALEAIPTAVVSPSGGDDTAAIQTAVDEVGLGGIQFDSGDFQLSGSVFVNNTISDNVGWTKAGRRISRATEAALAAAADEAEALAGKIRGLLSAGDSEKQDDEEQDTGKAIGEEDTSIRNSTADALERNSESDFEHLLLKTRIERMRD